MLITTTTLVVMFFVSKLLKYLLSLIFFIFTEECNISGWPCLTEPRQQWWRHWRPPWPPARSWPRSGSRSGRGSSWRPPWPRPRSPPQPRARSHSWAPPAPPRHPAAPPWCPAAQSAQSRVAILDILYANLISTLLFFMYFWCSLNHFFSTLLKLALETTEKAMKATLTLL